MAELPATYTDADKKKVIYRHIVGLHNASTIGYMGKPDGIVTTGDKYERLPFVCRQERNTSLMPNEDAAYQNYFADEELKFGDPRVTFRDLVIAFADVVIADPLCETSPEGQRKRKFRGSPTGTIAGLSRCGSDGTALTEVMRANIVSFATTEIKSNADCSLQGGTGGRRMGFSGSGQSLTIEFAGACVKSSVCHVDRASCHDSNF